MNIKTTSAAAVLAVAASSTSPVYAGSFLDTAIEAEVQQPVGMEQDDDGMPLWIILALIAAAAALAAGGAGGGT